MDDIDDDDDDDEDSVGFMLPPTRAWVVATNVCVCVIENEKEP